MALCGAWPAPGRGTYGEAAEHGAHALRRPTSKTPSCWRSQAPSALACSGLCLSPSIICVFVVVLVLVLETEFLRSPRDWKLEVLRANDWRRGEHKRRPEASGAEVEVKDKRISRTIWAR